MENHADKKGPPLPGDNAEEPGSSPVNPTNEHLLLQKIERLEKIQKALMTRVERSTESQHGAFSLFEGNILLANQIGKRTEDLKSLNDQLGQRTQQLQLIIRALPGAVFLFADDFSILQNFHGLGRDIPINSSKRLDEAFDPAFQKKLRAAHDFQKSTNTPNTFDFEFLENDTRRTFDVTVSAISHDFFVIYLRDTTEETLKKEVIETQKSQILQAAKMSSLGVMAGGVAHEINNPLGIIKLITSQIEDLHKEVPFNKELAEKLTAKVIKTTDRIAKIVHGLRTFSRDGSADAFEEVNAKDLIDETLSLCLERMRSHGVRFSVDPVDEKLAFLGRGVEISQVLVNLLNNADDAITKAAEKWVTLSVQKHGDWIEIHVTDSGGGIPPAVQKKLFQPFFTTKEIGKGTGIGLSISHGIVKSHRGELILDGANPNTCFIVRLPVHKPEMKKSKNNS